MIGAQLDFRREGAVVEYVADRSPAERAGLFPGDIIKTFNGNPLRSYSRDDQALLFASIQTMRCLVDDGNGQSDSYRLVVINPVFSILQGRGPSHVKR